MTYTIEELQTMTKQDLALILRGTKLTARGKETTLIDRIMEHQDKQPSQSPSPEADASQQNDAIDEAIANAKGADILDRIQAELRLKNETVVILRHHHFVTEADLREIDEWYMKRLELPLRDQKVLLKHAGKAGEPRRNQEPHAPVEDPRRCTAVPP